MANQKQRGGGSNRAGTAAAVGIGIGLILNAAKNADAADRKERIDRRVAKRKALQDSAETKREKAVTKIREAKEAKKARAARPPSKKTLDEQMVDDFNEDVAQQDRADAARKALEEYRQAVAKANWWQAEAAEAGDVPDMNARIFEKARRQAEADKAAREAMQREDFQRSQEDYKRQQADSLKAQQDSDRQVADRQEAFKQHQQDNADATRLDQLRDQHDRFGSKTSAESERAKEKAAEAAQKQKEEQARQFAEAVEKARGIKGGTAGSDLGQAGVHNNLNKEAMDGVDKQQ
ncbi:MAG: hypothetical protein ACT4OU_10085 [Hyphomicrobium sp.]